MQQSQVDESLHETTGTNRRSLIERNGTVGDARGIGRQILLINHQTSNNIRF